METTVKIYQVRCDYEDEKVAVGEMDYTVRATSVNEAFEKGFAAFKKSGKQLRGQVKIYSTVEGEYID